MVEPSPRNSIIILVALQLRQDEVPGSSLCSYEEFKSIRHINQRGNRPVLTWISSALCPDRGPGKAKEVPKPIHTPKSLHCSRQSLCERQQPGPHSDFLLLTEIIYPVPGTRSDANEWSLLVKLQEDLTNDSDRGIRNNVCLS